MDTTHTLTTWIDHNRFKAAAAVLVAVLLAAAVGCQSKTASLQDPDRRVTRSEYTADITATQTTIAAQRAALDADIAQFNATATAIDARIAAGVADLDRQDQIRAELFDLAGSSLTAWTSGGISTQAVVGTGITAFSLLFGIGAAADGRRKDKIIADNKAKTP
jgi:ABC-type glycerol-3-phosphate transport system substrate-binding protein